MRRLLVTALAVVAALPAISAAPARAEARAPKRRLETKGPAAAEVRARAPKRIQDLVAGSTFVIGAAALNAPGQPLRIRPGDTVVWTNLDPISHDVTFELLPFTAYLKSPGDSAQLTFTQPGHYVYQCNQHPELPGMHGLVFVTDDAP